MRPADLPGAERYPHGTRARYVSAKCRCADCRAANTRYYHERQARGRELAAGLTREIGAIPKLWTAPDGTTRERVYRRACPGPGGGVWCVGRGGEGSHLRKDSKGGCCRACRELLVWNGDVDAGPVRRHLRKLSRRGVGYKSVADAAGVSKTVLAQVLFGKKKAVRKRTADRVLAVTKDAIADHALVDAASTWRLLGELLALRTVDGTSRVFTKSELARRLGYRGRGIQFRRTKVLAATTLRVRKLHAKLMAEVGRQADVDDRAARYRAIEEGIAA